MTALRPDEQAYWDNYLHSLPEDLRPRGAFVSAGYAGTPEITDGLLDLYLSGKKTAGSSLVEGFVAAGDPLPQAGNYWIYLNSRNQPACILKTERITIHKFKDVPVEIAIAEGEGDVSLEYWRKVHTELYTPYLQAWGIQDLDDATVITEFFSLVSVNSNLSVAVKTSSIHGKGVFASRDIRCGEVAVKWDHTREISKSELEHLPPDERNYIEIQGDKVLLVGKPERFVNHSCAANTRPGDRCDIASRDISCGEEITADYGHFYVPSGRFPCKCGSANCRGVI